ncbi:hypothetical protein [Portibacter marinus]|uniref:hypothetical protein n=1 Tax=Portibacter marinus TaxID=2898660 RepID=UPI001F1959C8|nr:hypothetical protein [Portibacter marinus]
MEIPKEDPFEVKGNYIGSWDDNIYTNFPISAEIKSTGSDKFSGPFYYSQLGPYIPCCMDSGDNGTISFEIKGDSVIHFVYNQDLQFYMGGCPGTYEGSGLWNEKLGILSIDFTGEDCDGTHTGGKIILRNQR